MSDEQTIRDALDRYYLPRTAAHAALDRLVAERDRYRDSAWPEEVHTRYLVALDERDAALARAEAAEKEAEMYRREAAHARTLASGWAEANAERAAKNLHNDARKIAEARCATLEAALREMVEIAEETDPYPTSDGHPLYAARAALAAATTPACDHAITLADKVTGEERCAECGAATPPAEKEGTFERSLLRADIKAGNAEAAEAQLQRIKRLEADSPPAEKEGTP